MHTIKDEIRIEAAANRVYDALSRQSGYRCWWNAVAEVPETVGGEAKLRFMKDGNPVHMRFRIDEMTPNKAVRWSCVGHDMPSWIGTSLEWKILGSGTTVVLTLEHSGWKDHAPEMVAQGWKHFLASLKSYVETGVGQPW